MALSAKTAGLVLAGTGAAHFVAPKAFVPITVKAFPSDTKQWVLRNGATELALGLAVSNAKTRKLGLVGLLGYVGWLGSRILQNR
ncbi:hypothetical protein UO65_4410 [Actinokineospora spheciospongiae]|uniref:Uncharacterized protein n=1 Tax=Actinokineospora spheciospongiae TaxID=909613 RepID=W7IU65_9PSEU|nr:MULTISPECIES: hypothetical protein [Actinokineospora]EWC60302.1 hypothetical protein UO65_4410 [Actinokineospora spheciospongiae]MCG8915985.1 hypothetical protein [Actinokineospora sp. PR83]PWW52693.1 hypothetical protein DFQ13_11752 [Actinokineospora spheciospongiae]